MNGVHLCTVMQTQLRERASEQKVCPARFSRRRCRRRRLTLLSSRSAIRIIGWCFSLPACCPACLSAFRPVFRPVLIEQSKVVDATFFWLPQVLHWQPCQQQQLWLLMAPYTRFSLLLLVRERVCSSFSTSATELNTKLAWCVPGFSDCLPSTAVVKQRAKGAILFFFSFFFSCFGARSSVSIDFLTLLIDLVLAAAFYATDIWSSFSFYRKTRFLFLRRASSTVCSVFQVGS